MIVAGWWWQLLWCGRPAAAGHAAACSVVHCFIVVFVKNALNVFVFQPADCVGSMFSDNSDSLAPGGLWSNCSCRLLAPEVQCCQAQLLLTQ